MGVAHEAGRPENTLLVGQGACLFSLAHWGRTSGDLGSAGTRPGAQPKGSALHGLPFVGSRILFWGVASFSKQDLIWVLGTPSTATR